MTAGRSQKGFSLVELLATVTIFSVIMVAGYVLLLAGDEAWTFTDTRIGLQQSLRQTLNRISLELQESGQDDLSNWQVNILDNAGPNGSDILRFAVPLCLCGTNAIDANGNVKNWGATTNWGDANCANNYTLENNGKVKICHVPPGNPDNPQTIQVNENALNAHLGGHGDWIGDCGACDPTVNTNRTVEYSLDNNNQLYRRVLDAGNNVLNQDMFAANVSNFQVTLDQAQFMVTLTVSVSATTNKNRAVTMIRTFNIPLRNRG